MCDGLLDGRVPDGGDLRAGGCVRRPVEVAAHREQAVRAARGEAGRHEREGRRARHEGAAARVEEPPLPGVLRATLAAGGDAPGGRLRSGRTSAAAGRLRGSPPRAREAQPPRARGRLVLAGCSTAPPLVDPAWSVRSGRGVGGRRVVRVETRSILHAVRVLRSWQVSAAAVGWGSGRSAVGPERRMRSRRSLRDSGG